MYAPITISECMYVYVCKDTSVHHAWVLFSLLNSACPSVQIPVIPKTPPHKCNKHTQLSERDVVICKFGAAFCPAA